MSRILVIQLGRLGDAIQTTPLLEALRQQNPRAQVEILVFQNVAVALDGMGFVQVHSLRERSLPGGLSELERQIELGRSHRSISQPEMLRVFDELGLPAYDRLLNCSYSPLAAWIAQKAQSKDRVGPIITKDGEVLFQHKAHVYISARANFRTQNWFNLVDLWRCTAGRAKPPKAGARPFIFVAATVPFSLPPGPRVALNPGSSQGFRRWPASNFAAIAEGLARNGFHPILVGSSADESVCAEVQARCPVPVTNLCGHTSVSQMANVLSQMRLLVSNDTGAIHIASAVGCRVLGLFGASAYFAETSPWGEGHVMLQSPLELDGVQLRPDLVLTAALFCVGLVDEEQFGRRLAAEGARAWKTFFLPLEADPMGGLAYKPLHADGECMETRFTRILRHLFAASFCKNHAGPRADGRGRSSSTRRNGPESFERGQLFRAMVPFLTTFETMASSAARCRILSRQPASTGSAREISVRVQELIRTIENLKVAAEDVPAVKPVVHFLDWQCRMMPPESPTETFRAHEREYRFAAKILSTAMQRFDTRA